MKLQQRKLKALSDAILELYRPAPDTTFPEHLVQVLARGFSTDQLVTYNELPSAASPELVVVTNTNTDYAAPYYPAFQRHMMENPLIPLLFKTRNVSATRLSDLISPKEFRKTNIYNEYYRKVALDMQMACGFVENSRAVGINISRQGRDFTDDELFFFGCLVPHLRQAFDLAQALEMSSRTSGAFVQAAQVGGWGLISFREDDRILYVSPLAEELAEASFHCWPRAGHKLPRALGDITRRLKGNPDAELQPVRRPLTFALPDGNSFALRYGFDPTHAHQLLIFERRLRLTNPQSLGALGLSPREAEVAFWLVQDKTYWEIGKILGISPRTVEKHAGHIFSKLGISNRNELSAKVRDYFQ